MKKTEEEYLKPINILSDFNSRTGKLVTQMLASTDAIYSPALGSLADGLLNEYKSFSPIVDLLPKIDISIGSSLAGLAREANLAISSLTNNTNVLALGSIVSEKPHSWLNKIDSIYSLSPLSGIAQNIDQSFGSVTSGLRIELKEALRVSSTFIDQVKVATLGIESNFSKLAATSILAENSLSGIKWNEFGAQIGLDQSTQFMLGDSFRAVSDSYSKLFESIQAVPLSIIDYAPLVIRQPPIEYYTGAELCRLISIPDQPLAERMFFSKKIIIDNKLALEKNLPKIDSDLVQLWDGANQALTSNNPDRVRHFSASLRELITQVLHQLSPDDAVKKWSSEPSFYKDGRPTREARLMYVCRNINAGPFKKFIQKDVAATIEFINIFHEGTHKIKASFTENQMLALKTKTESTLNFLMQIGWGDSEN